MLDEVDIINAVSGGSIAAAYYGLYRDRIFEDFESRFLRRDVESDLKRMLATNLLRLASPRFGRSDLLAEYFDREIFDRKTFADLARGSLRPFVVINAADLSTGARFPFTQGQFDLLCSDLSAVPVGRAVAASAALPPYFTAITLWNYAGTCGAVSLPGLAAGFLQPSAAHEAARLHEARSYLDRMRRPYVHLVDGGLIDNLGMRVAIDFAVELGGFVQLVEALGYHHLTHAVFISVNAETDPNYAIDQSADAPNFWQALNALKLPGRAHSIELVEQLRTSFTRWREEVKGQRRIATSANVDPAPHFYFIDVSLRAIADQKEREVFMGIPTALTLDHATVDSLRAIARRLLLDSPDFKRLVSDLGGEEPR